VAEAFSTTHTDFETLSVGELLSAAHVPEASSLCSANRAESMRLWPHRHATDGFFAAVWRKKV
jgi:16S rRNA (cytosine967-C5)-methyltransferase